MAVLIEDDIVLAVEVVAVGIGARQGIVLVVAARRIVAVLLVVHAVCAVAVERGRAHPHVQAQVVGPLGQLVGGRAVGVVLGPRHLPHAGHDRLHVLLQNAVHRRGERAEGSVGGHGELRGVIGQLPIHDEAVHGTARVHGLGDVELVVGAPGGVVGHAGVPVLIEHQIARRGRVPAHRRAGAPDAEDARLGLQVNVIERAVMVVISLGHRLGGIVAHVLLMVGVFLLGGNAIGRGALRGETVGHELHAVDARLRQLRRLAGLGAGGARVRPSLARAIVVEPHQAAVMGGDARRRGLAQHRVDGVDLVPVGQSPRRVVRGIGLVEEVIDTGAHLQGKRFANTQIAIGAHASPVRL